MISITYEALTSQLINGLVLGMLYALLAVGLSLIFGLIGVINFAHGVFFTLGAYFAFTLRGSIGFWPALVAGAALVGVLGLLVERTLIRRLYDRDPLSGFLMTFGLALLVEESIRAIWGAAGRPFGVPEGLTGLVVYGPLVQTEYRLAVLAIAVVLMLALWLVLDKTRFGTVVRAGTRDSLMIQLLGTNIRRAFAIVFAAGSALAGVAGVLAAPLWGLAPDLGTSAIMPSFVVVVIGGLGSIAGAVVSGVLVGVVVSLSIALYPPVSEVAMYVLMSLVLLLRPRGLFGEQWEKFE